MADVEKDGMWQVRATAWELLALSFRYPTEDLAEAVESGEWIDAAREIVEALGAQMPIDWDADFDSGDASDADGGVAAELRSLRIEATRLFVGTPQPVVSPYESVWRAEDDGVQALLFVSPHAMEVERFMRSCALSRPENTNEPLDHIAAECELLEYLAAAEAGLVNPSEGGGAWEGFPGGSPRAAYHLFLEEHARIWMPRFAEAVVSASGLPVYRAAASVLTVMLQPA